MKLTMVDIERIKPYPLNAKKHPQEQIDKIIRSIGLTGFDQPIVTNGAYIVIKGHGRLLAAQQMGLTQVPVVALDISDDVAGKARLIDNKSAESEYDLEILLQEIGRFEDEILDTGYGDDEFQDLLNKLEADNAIKDYDWGSLDDSNNKGLSEDDPTETILKFSIPSDRKDAVLEFLNVKSGNPKLLGEALILLCEN